MVGPSRNEDPNRAGRTKLKAGIVLLVGVSAGLVTLSGGGSIVEIATAIAGGLAVGAALLAYLVRISV
ncbi:hypothetical protein [Halorussus marinus]|uniref:hypothetical protein n=1 Tax=Halorussus marinus TaxID=2505976 RepID=UPI00106E1ECA|nr:hypothetical protein [Halorussus marinus]